MLGTAAMLTGIVGCSGTPSPQSPAPAPSPTTAPAPPSQTGTAPTAPAPSESETVIGTVVRFSTDDASVDVTIGADSPATRDFLSMLPLRIALEDLGGREKISYLTRQLNYAGSPGSDPENGDLIYFTPWGNLGFYYNAAGIEYSEQTLHIGTYDATIDQLNSLEGEDVAVEVVQ
jgi:hypothetical protein